MRTHTQINDRCPVHVICCFQDWTTLFLGRWPKPQVGFLNGTQLPLVAPQKATGVFCFGLCWHLQSRPAKSGLSSHTVNEHWIKGICRWPKLGEKSPAILTRSRGRDAKKGPDYSKRRTESWNWLRPFLCSPARWLAYWRGIGRFAMMPTTTLAPALYPSYV